LARFDEHLRYVRVNRVLAEIHGIPASAHLGKTVCEALPRAGPESAADVARVRDTGEPLDREVHDPAGGASRSFRVSYYPVRGEERIAAVGMVVVDITERKRVEEALRVQEETLRLAQQIARVGTFEQDVRTGVEIWSPELEALYGLSPGSFARTRDAWASLVHPDDFAAVNRNFAEAMKSGAFEGEWRAIWPDGSIHWLSGRGFIFRDEEGAPARFLGVNIDITDRKRMEEALRESEGRFRIMTDAMPQIIWAARADGHHDYFNQRWYEYTGLPYEGAAGDAWQEVVHPDDRAETVHRWTASLESGEPYEAEHRCRRHDGEWRWFLTRAYPVRDAAGRIDRWYGTSTDIDHAKKLEDALRDADRHKDEFLGMLSHELRNPLAPIRSSIFILKRVRAGAEADRAHAVIQRQVEHLTRLVDDLLDVTRIARGKIELRRARVDLSAIVRRTGDDHRSVMAERGIELVVDAQDGALVEGDATRIAQVIGNLLNNAAKFTGRGGTVSLSLRIVGEGAEIAVRDTGVGIERALLGDVFTPFVQAERTLARSAGGLGLGLALVKGLTELHGGSVSASSAGPGRGAEFLVRLPLAKSPRPAANVDGTGAGIAPRKRHRVLVVDDNHDVAASLADLISLFGHDAELAYDGASALAKARAQHPDVILCDIGLPGMSGYEVARALRADTQLASAYIVAVSGYAQPEDLRRAAEAGFDRHLAKPPNPEDIERLLA
jgi:PAS domain S-box-containing protein